MNKRQKGPKGSY